MCHSSCTSKDLTQCIIFSILREEPQCIYAVALELSITKHHTKSEINKYPFNVSIMGHDLLLETSSHWFKSSVSATRRSLLYQTLWSYFWFIMFAYSSGAYSTPHPYIVLTTLSLCAQPPLGYVLDHSFISRQYVTDKGLCLQSQAMVCSGRVEEDQSYHCRHQNCSRPQTAQILPSTLLSKHPEILTVII